MEKRGMGFCLDPHLIVVKLDITPIEQYISEHLAVN